MGPRSLTRPDGAETAGGAVLAAQSRHRLFGGHSLPAGQRTESEYHTRRRNELLVNRGWVSRTQVEPENRLAGQCDETIDLVGGPIAYRRTTNAIFTRPKGRCPCLQRFIENVRFHRRLPRVPRRTYICVLYSRLTNWWTNWCCTTQWTHALFGDVVRAVASDCTWMHMESPEGPSSCS